MNVILGWDGLVVLGGIVKGLGVCPKPESFGQTTLGCRSSDEQFPGGYWLAIGGKPVE